MLPGTTKLLLEKILEMTGLTMSQLAIEIGINRNTLGRVGSGAQRPRMQVNRELIAFYFYLVREKNKIPIENQDNSL